jgi:endo-1,4-beta-D-glucanase Y
MYFMMSLLFAANRWNDEGYMKDAQAILKACWKGNGNSLFNEQSYIVTFQPSQGNNSWSDPSYSLPAFVDLFTRWSETNNDKWGKATEATRTHLYVSSNKQSGLFSDYNNFDGTPHAVEFNGNATKYMYDAMRCAMNFGMDYYLFGVDADRETEMAKRIIDFFERDGYQHGRFNWDGSNPSESYTTGEKGANAVATYALMNDASYEAAIKKNLEMAWNERFMTGQYRYYDGLVHYLAMLHLSGAFKIWKPKPEVSEKEVTANEYNGINIANDTTFYSFESCKLYKVSAKPEPKQGINTAISLNNSVRVRSTNNAIVIDNAPAGTKYTVTDMNGRILSASKTNSASEEIRLTNKGAMLVIVGNKTYRVSK